MITLRELWAKLRQGPRYRREFASQFAKQAIAHQVDSLLTQYGFTQKQLAERAGLTQGVVSRAADPTYGNLTVNTLIRIAAGFDAAYVSAIVPFSEIPNWFDRFYSKPFIVPSFEQEDAALQTETASDAPETLSRILNANHAHPQFETVVRIARAVKVTVGWLLEEPVHGSQLSLEEVDMLRAVVRAVDKIAAARKPPANV